MGTQINYSDMIQHQRSVRPESKPTGLLNAAVHQQNRWQMESKQVLYSLIPPLPLSTKNQGREKLLSQGIPRLVNMHQQQRYQRQMTQAG